jgi:malate dehydrogenase (oxaloacetate-decarboxylating)(NADP+)
VALNPITDWSKYEEELYDRLGNDNKMVRLVTNRAKMDPKRIFAEADHLDVLKAANCSRRRDLFAYSTGEHGILS